MTLIIDVFLYFPAGIQCPAPKRLDYATIVKGAAVHYAYGDKITYKCDQGYEQYEGSSVLECGRGKWIGTLLKCRSKY